MKINAQALRAERLRRLSAETAKKKQTTASAAPSKPATPAPARTHVTPTKPVAAAAPKAPVSAPAATKAPAKVQSPETLVAVLRDPSTLSRLASYDLSLFGAGQQNPHWLVLADGHPVAEIQYADQDSSACPRDLFESDNYGSAVVQALGQEEPAKILSSMKARVYASSVAKSDAYAAVKQEVTAAADSQVRMARAELRDNMMNVLGLVLKAQTKNLLANDLKAEFFDQLANVGVDERTATFAIENAWKKAASTYFQACFKQAEEWMDLPQEAYIAIEKQIDSMVAREVEPVHTASANDIPSAAHNVAIETRTVVASAAPAGGAPDFGALFFPR